MADVRFEVRHEFDAPARVVWDELVDWEGHAEWIPMTWMEVEPGDPTAVGARFTAFTGVGRVALEDRMRVVSCEWDDETSSGRCTVEKLGPILTGEASFTVSSNGEGAVVDWIEDVTVPYWPQFAAAVPAFFGAQGFKAAMRKLAKLTAGRTTAPAR